MSAKLTFHLLFYCLVNALSPDLKKHFLERLIFSKLSELRLFQKTINNNSSTPLYKPFLASVILYFPEKKEMFSILTNKILNRFSASSFTFLILVATPLAPAEVLSELG